MSEPPYNSYVVKWSIDIEASSPEVAAEMARAIQLNPDSIATVFEVVSDHGYTTTRVDLNPEHS